MCRARTTIRADRRVRWTALLSGALLVLVSCRTPAAPVFFFLGRYDRHVDARIAERDFDALQAPAKERGWFESSAHNPPFEEPEPFDATLTAALESVGPPSEEQ